MIKDRNIALDANIDVYKIRGALGTLCLLTAKGPGAGIRAKAYYVNGDGGSDNYDGLTPQTPYATIAKAVTVSNGRLNWTAPWGNRDVIYVYPHKYAENLTALPYGSSIVGVGTHLDYSVAAAAGCPVIQPASGVAVDVTSFLSSYLANIMFDGYNGQKCFIAGSMNGCHLDNCQFIGETGTYAIEIETEFAYSRITNCFFSSFTHGIYVDISSPKSFTGKIEDCEMTFITTAGVYFSTTSNCPALMNRCFIGDGNTPVDFGLDNNYDSGGSSSALHVANTMFIADACDPASGDADSHYSNCYLNSVLMT